MKSAQDHRAISAVFTAYWEALRLGHATEALAALEHGLAAGESPEGLIRHVICRGQHEVGRLWEEGRLSIADEHVASSVAEEVLAALRTRRRSGNPAAKRVVLACAEGEWHTMPARIAGDLAATGGLEVVMIGGSVPAEHVGVYLRQAQPDALALSVTMTTNLIGAWRTIQAAHLVGVPVVVGGAAWGQGPRRAEILGADFYVEDPAEMARAMRLAAVRPLRPPATLPAEALRLSESGDRWGRSTDAETMLLRGRAAALACDDPTILDDIERWLTQRSMSGGTTPKELVAIRSRLADD